MLVIILLIAATGGIVAFARGRGGKPWLWGTLTIVGFFLVPNLVTFFAVILGADANNIRANSQLWFFVSAVAWVAVLPSVRASYWAAVTLSRTACGPAKIVVISTKAMQSSAKPAVSPTLQRPRLFHEKHTASQTQAPGALAL